MDFNALLSMIELSRNLLGQGIVAEPLTVVAAATT